MLWDAAEAALKTHIETGWAAGAHASVPLVFENEGEAQGASYVHVTFEGTYADKSIYGSAGKRIGVEGGLVFFHAFVPSYRGKATATAMVVAMTTILELQTVSDSIKLEGGNPPTPFDHGDILAPNQQPDGSYYRCSGSVPFIVLSSR